MQIDLPPVISVKRFLREQRARKKALRSWCEAAFAGHYAAGRLKGQRLRQFAQDYGDQLKAAGAFDLEAENTPDLLLIKTARSYSARGTVLWPVGLATNTASVADAYSEEAIMLVGTGMSFHPTKVIVHEAPFWVCLTRHCLERLVERYGVAGDLAANLPSACSTLLDRAGLALAHGIAIEVDEGEWSRTAFVPHSGGLLVLTNRLVAAPRYYEDLGFKFNFVTQRYSDTYIKRGLLAPAADTPAGGACISTWVATTYLAPEQLSPAQRTYANRFEEWAKLKTRCDKRLAVQVQFDPDFTYRPERQAAHFDEEGERTVRALQQSLQGVSFKPHPRAPVSYLIEPDMDSRGYQAALLERMSSLPRVV